MEKVNNSVERQYIIHTDFLSDFEVERFHALLDELESIGCTIIFES